MAFSGQFGAFVRRRHPCIVEGPLDQRCEGGGDRVGAGIAAATGEVENLLADEISGRETMQFGNRLDLFLFGNGEAVDVGRKEWPECSRLTISDFGRNQP